MQIHFSTTLEQEARYQQLVKTYSDIIAIEDPENPNETQVNNGTQELNELMDMLPSDKSENFYANARLLTEGSDFAFPKRGSGLKKTHINSNLYKLLRNSKPEIDPNTFINMAVGDALSILEG